MYRRQSSRKMLINRGGKRATTAARHHLHIARTENKLGRIATLLAIANGLHLSQQLEAAQFARGRARQSFRSHYVIANALILGQIAASVIEVESDRFTSIGNALGF